VQVEWERPILQELSSIIQKSLRYDQHWFFVACDSAANQVELAALIGAHVGLKPGKDLSIKQNSTGANLIQMALPSVLSVHEQALILLRSSAGQKRIQNPAVFCEVHVSISGQGELLTYSW
jgi:hypothetical protein